MPRIPLLDQPDDARLWVFAARDPLTPEAVARVESEVDRFLDGWAAHGHPLTSSRDLAEGRFLFVAVDRASEPPSGCSIDAMVRHLRSLEAAVGTQLVAHGPVWYRDADGDVQCVERARFKSLVAEGQVDSDTHVFDTTVTELGALRGGRFEVPARESWHGPAFLGTPRS